MLVANCDEEAEFHQYSEQMRSNVGTAWVIADGFRKLFFTSVRTDDASLDRYLRNRKSPVSVCSVAKTTR